MKYFIYKVFERNGEFEYTHKGLTSFDPEETGYSPEEWLEDTAKNFYSEGEKYSPDDDYYWHFGMLITQAHSITEVTKEEYDILRKYIY